MPPSKEKLRRKQLVDNLRDEERAKLKASMPMSVENLAALLQYLDRQVDLLGCDHSLDQSRTFLARIDLDPEQVVPWLQDHGGYCDCEVVYNVSETLDLVTYRPPLVPLPASKPKAPPLGPVVETGMGFALRVEAPWRARRGRGPAEGDFVFRLGRKGSRYLQLFAKRAPEEGTADDSRWIQRWRTAKDNLKDRGDWTVERRPLGPKGEFQAVTVSTRHWTPTLTWIFAPTNPQWHGVFETSLSAAASDLREVERLFLGAVD